MVEALVVQAGYETQVFKDGVHELVPVARAGTQAVEGFLQNPKHVLVCIRVS